MVIAPEKVDAYLRAKGIACRMSDAQWETTIKNLRPLFATGRWYQVKLLHQKEDSLRRFSSRFPELIPTPYRFIDYIRFAAGDSSHEAAVIQLLESRAIPFITKVHSNGPDEDDVVTIICVGPKKT